MKRLLALSIAAASVLALGACAPKSGEAEASSQQSVPAEERVLRYGYVAVSSDVLSGLNGIAQKQGFFKEELAKVNARFEAIPFAKAGPAINSALASGDLDVAGLGDVPAAVAKAGGAETELIDIQPSDYSTHLVVRKGLNISSVAELKGKKVAFQTGSYMHRIFYQILEKASLKPEDVEIVNMSEVDAANALAGGSVDAVPASAMKGVTLVENGSADLLFDTKEDPDLARLSATVARTQFAKENEDVMNAYFRGLIRAQEYAKKNPQDLRTLYIEAGTPAAVVDKVYPALTDYSSVVGTQDVVLSNYQYVADFLLKNQLIKSELQVSGWYNGSYYDNAKSELGA